MKKELRNIDGCLWELTITVDAPEVKKEYATMLDQYRKYAVVPGFRKGKAPLSMVEAQFGARIHDEFVKTKAGEYYEKIMKEDETLKPYSEGELMQANWKLGEDFIAVYNFEVVPEIKIENYTGLDVYHTPRTIEEKDIDDFINDMRRKMADWITPEDGIAQVGDHVVLDFSPVEDVPGVQPFTQTVVVGGSQYAAEFSAFLTGAATGAEYQGLVVDKMPPFKCVVNEIHREILPALDDEFAKDADYESMAEMRKRVAEELQKETDHENRESLHSAIWDAVITANPFELPESMIDNYTNSLMEKQKGPKKEKDSYKFYYRSMALIQLKRYFAYEALEQTLGVTVTDEEVGAFAESECQRLNITREEFDTRNARAIETGEIRDRVTELKMLDMIAASATIRPESDRPAPQGHVHDENCDCGHDHEDEHSHDDQPESAD